MAERQIRPHTYCVVNSDIVTNSEELPTSPLSGVFPVGVRMNK